MAITTKRGDKGYTTGVNNRQIKKNSPFVQLIGTLDELQAHLGIVYEMYKDSIDSDIYLKLIESIQIAMGNIYNNKEDEETFAELSKLIETEIEGLNYLTKKQTEFILPIGSVKVTHINLLRTVCRKAERDLINYEDTQLNSVFPKIKIFLNRLSDYLYLQVLKERFE